MAFPTFYTHKPSASYVLDGQIHLAIHFRSDQIYRTVSFNDGKEWMPWVKMKKHKTRRSVALACIPSGQVQFLAYQVWDLANSLPQIKFPDEQKFVLRIEQDYGFNWSESIAPMGGDGRFLSGPALLCSGDGETLYVFGLGLDCRMYWAKTMDRGLTWLWRWEDMGPATFQSEPSAVMSADGTRIMIFGIGMDKACWMARSIDEGKNWTHRWSPIGKKKFSSGLAACISASGLEVIVAGRGLDDRFFYNRSNDGGMSWMSQWKPIGEGVFDSGPALCCSWDFTKIHAFGLGRDGHIWRAQAMGENVPFEGWWKTSLGGV